MDFYFFLVYRWHFIFLQIVFLERSLTPLQLETRFWGQNYLDLVQGGVRGLHRGEAPKLRNLRQKVVRAGPLSQNASYRIGLVYQMENPVSPHARILVKK